MKRKGFANINLVVIVGLLLFVGIVGYFVVGQLFYKVPNYQKQAVLDFPKEFEYEIEGWRRIEVVRGGGFRGPWRMNDSVFHFVDDPTVAISDTGIVAVVWADQKRQNLFLQIYEVGDEIFRRRFDEPTNVSRTPGIFSWLPRMVFNPNDPDRIYIIWQEIVFLPGGDHGGEIFFARSIDGGRTFDDFINLSDTIAGEGKGRVTLRHWHNGSLDLVVGPGGNIYVAWTEFAGALHFTRSVDGGETFSEPIHIAGGGFGIEYPAPTRAPSIAVGPEGLVYLVWTATRGQVSNLYLAKSVNQGRTFSKPVPLLTGSGGHLDAPRIVVDSRGTIHLVYANSPTGLFGLSHIRYSSSDDGGKTFQRSKKVSVGKEQGVGAGFPVIDIDNEDNLYLIWEIFPDNGWRSQGLGFTFSKDGGEIFEPFSVIPGSADPSLGFSGSQQGLLMRKMAVSGDGMIVVVNSTFLENERSHIWLHVREVIKPAD